MLKQAAQLGQARLDAREFLLLRLVEHHHAAHLQQAGAAAQVDYHRQGGVAAVDIDQVELVAGLQHLGQRTQEHVIAAHGFEVAIDEGDDLVTGLESQ